MNNDRLKFRLWDIKNEEYVEDQCDECCIYFDGRLHAGAYCDDSYTGHWDEYEQHEVIIEQCTGLRDINCNLIYAGDRGILTVFGGIGPNGGYVDSDKQVNVRVEWVDECAGFYFVDDNGIYYDMTNSTEIFEIIGNIHTKDKK